MNSDNSRSWLTGALIAVIGAAVGAVLAFAIFTAVDEDISISFPEPLGHPMPTPCENYAHLASGIENELWLRAIDELGLTDELIDLFNACARSAR